jgi:tetratricopeptide (TPR) repeat protein
MNRTFYIAALFAALALPAGAQPAAAPPDTAAAQAATADGRWADALALWSAASNRLPDNPTVTAELGWAQLQAGSTDDARRTFARALRLDPGNVRADAGRVALAIRALNPAEAERIALAGVRANPKSAVAYRTLGDARTAASHRAEAEDSYARAVELDPNDAANHAGFGSALLTRNKAGDALREYRAAVRLAPKNGAYQEGLARAAMAGMRYGEAARAFVEAMGLALQPAPDWKRIDTLAQSALDALSRASAGVRDGYETRQDVSEANAKVLTVTDAIAALPGIEAATAATDPAMAQRALAYDLMGQAAASDLVALQKGTTSEASDAFVFREQARRALAAARAAGSASERIPSS